MDELLKKLEEWDGRLAAWNELFHRNYRRLARRFSGWFRKRSAEEEERLAAEARRQTGEEVLVELFAFLDEFCIAYLEAKLPQDQAKARKIVGESPDLMTAVWSYVAQSIDLVRRASDGDRLRRALAAFSIEDLRVDLELAEETAGKAWLAAVRAGLDPAPAFQEAAAASNPGTGGGGAYTRQFLAEFGDSLHFRTHVRPELPRVSA